MARTATSIFAVLLQALPSRRPVRTGLMFLSLFAFDRVAAQHNADTKVLYLSGRDNTHTESWEFFCTGGRQSGYWTTIEVPSCWEQQGFGHYDYGRDYRTYGKQFRFSDEKGLYRHTFQAPADWAGKAVYLVFEGVMTDAEVRINGTPAGPVHQGAFYQFRYPVSDKLRFGGSNLLEVTVSKMSADHSVNRAERYADYWIFGGIFRPVFLEVFPGEHMLRTAVNAPADGNFSIDVFTENIAGKRDIFLEILDPTGHPVAQQSQAIGPGATKTTVRCKVSDPLLWSAETPQIYTARLALKNGDETIHRTAEVFGFRSIEIRRGDGVYINGVKMKFKGINRHCFWPETGRTLNRNIDRLDIELMKDMNMNAVRCSHYPPDRSFLELCDSLGLYVLDELAGWQNAYDTEAGEKLVREMVIRDVNHPSVIFWSNGNEGGTNKELDDDFLLYDPSTRPVIHAHHRPGNDYNGIETNHYEKYYSTKSILEDSLIYIPTEFLHAQDDGGAAAGLYDFWEMMWSAPRSGGGFIWALLDEGVVRTDLGGYIDVNRVNAPDGVLGPHREKEGSFYALKEIFSPVVIRNKTLPAPFEGQLELENRYHFTNLRQCRFSGVLVDFKGPGERLPGHEVKKEFSLRGPDIAPGERGMLNLPLPEGWKQYDGLQLTAIDPSGKEIMRWSWKTGRQEELLKGLTGKPAAGDAVVFGETDSTFILSAFDIRAHFDKTSGRLDKVEYAQGLNPPFGNGPVLVPEQPATTPVVRHYRENDGYALEFRYEAAALKSVKWKMHTNGWLQLDYEYALEGDQPFTGVSFNFPESDIIGVKWLGNGPYRVWKNRNRGGVFDVWESMYNNTHTGSAPWAYPEFKGYFSDIAWMEFNTVDGKFLVASGQEGLFVRLFDFYGLSGPTPHPALPPGDISFLDAIPPIGTKLATGLDTKTEELGPESELNHPAGPLRRTLYFYFGLPGAE
ncbi:MAG: glycoside hydrolase family 2 [Lewinellaceae bacterium]|nr:glycoside hydrolase family 2 [Lewinellaceae bacterium]